MMGSILKRSLVPATLALLVGLSACSLHVDKDDKGKEKRVDINTPFGDLKVRNDNVVAKDTGLPTYPGAQLKPRNEHDDNKANVNIDSPFFSLKVVALTYTTQ